MSPPVPLPSVKALAALAFAPLLGLGCGNPVVPPSDAAADLSSPGDIAMGDGGTPIFTEVTMTGCASLTVAAGRPRCAGPAPLTVTLVPLTPTQVNGWLWTEPGAVPPTSKSPAPTVTYSLPGSYTVALVVGGPAGTANAGGDVVVLPASTGEACEQDSQCAPGYACLCSPLVDGGSTCPGALSRGICTRSCDGAVCGPMEMCADFSRAAPKGQPPGDSQWRHPLCLPACAQSSDCRIGFACRELPVIAPGARAGSAYSWKRACYPPVLGDVGASCVDADGKIAPAACLTGECDPLGARGLCTLGCSQIACPSYSACAAFAADPNHPLCLIRCDASHPCADPLLACQVAGAPGTLGFTVPASEPAGATYCSPRRCVKNADCTPAGSCTIPGGSPDGGTSSDGAATGDAAQQDLAITDLGVTIFDGAALELSISLDAGLPDVAGVDLLPPESADANATPVDLAAPLADLASEGGAVDGGNPSVGFCRRAW